MAKALQKVLLVTGATGAQGGAVVNSILRSSQASEFTILAVTRDPSSQSAQKLAAKSNQIKVIQGDFNNIPALFAAAKKATDKPIWGVYSVQVFSGKGQTTETEEAYGKQMVDASKAASVKHFVYSSVDRGGEQRSWSNPTNVEHFASKHNIELHLRDTAGSAMGWTILRPVAFMDNIKPGLAQRVFFAAMTAHLGEKALQFVAVKDIGAAGAQAFLEPDKFNQRAVGIAGDELNVSQLGDVSEAALGYRLKPTFSIFGTIMGYAAPEMGRMLQWFGDEGYGVDIAKVRADLPHVTDFKEWLENDSPFEKSKA